MTFPHIFMEAEINDLHRLSFGQLTPDEHERRRQILNENRPIPPEGSTGAPSMEVKLAHTLSKPHEGLRDEGKGLD